MEKKIKTEMKKINKPAVSIHVSQTKTRKKGSFKINNK